MTIQHFTDDKDIVYAISWIGIAQIKQFYCEIRMGIADNLGYMWTNPGQPTI